MKLTTSYTFIATLLALCCLVMPYDSFPKSCLDAKSESLNASNFVGQWYVMYSEKTKLHEITAKYSIDNKTLYLNIIANSDGKLKKSYVDIKLEPDLHNGYRITSNEIKVRLIKLLSKETFNGIEWRIFCGMEIDENGYNDFGLIMAQIEESKIDQLALSELKADLSMRYNSFKHYWGTTESAAASKYLICNRAQGKSLNQENARGKWYTVVISMHQHGKPYLPEFTLQLLSDNKTLNLNTIIPDCDEQDEHRTYSINITSDPDQTNGYNIERGRSNLFYLKLLDSYYKDGIEWRIFCTLEKSLDPKIVMTQSVGYIMADKKNIKESVLLDANNELSGRFGDFRQNSYFTHYKLNICNGASAKVPLFATLIAAFYMLL